MNRKHPDWENGKSIPGRGNIICVFYEVQCSFKEKISFTGLIGVIADEVKRAFVAIL